MDKYARFEQWLRDNGARFDQLELREYDDDVGSKSSMVDDSIGEEKKETSANKNHSGMHDDSDGNANDSEMRGVHAISHIPPNTLCMMIPRRCLITVEMGQATPIGQAIMSSDLDLDAPKHIFLMIYILWDRKVNGKNSFFHPYYEILPSTLRNMPIFWSESELSHLQGSYLLHQIADRNSAIEEDYHAICQIAPLEKICTLDEFKWARMCVCSRNFGLQIDGHRTSALVPHADMLNHYRPRETKWTFDEEKQAFTITTLQFIQAGSEVFDSYGQKCNHRFLLNYGFAVEDNRELDGFCPNEVPVELYVSESDPLYNEKLEFWTRGEAQPLQTNNHPNNNNRQYPNNANEHTSLWNHQQAALPPTPILKRVRLCVANNENTRLLFSLLRVLACNEEELRAIASPATNSNFIAVDSSSNQHLMMDHHYGNTNHHPTNDVTRSLFGLSSSVDNHTASTTRHNFHVHNFHSQHQHHPNIHPQQHFHHNAYRPPFSQHHYQHHPQAIDNNGFPGSSPNTYQRSCRDIRHPISIRNEREAMRLLLQVVNRHLQAYPITLQQDCADLQDIKAYPRFSNIRHAKIQVRGEKEVLHHYAAWARTALDVLDVLEDELNQEHGIVGGGSVEVRLVGGQNRMMTVLDHNGSSGGGMYYNTNTMNRPPGFDYVIRHMEDDESVHHTILRYCADVLGSLRREEFKAIRKQQRSLINQHHRTSNTQHSSSGYNGNNNNDSSDIIRNGYA